MSFIMRCFVKRRHIVMLYFLAQLYITVIHSSAPHQHNIHSDIANRVNSARVDTMVPPRIALTTQSTAPIRSLFLETSPLTQHNTSKNKHSSPSTVLPPASWKVIETDILIPSNNNGEKNSDVKYGATPYNVQLWKKDPVTGNYVVPMRNNLKSPTMRKRFEWVKGYISRGANIVFRDAKSSDSQWFYFTEDPQNSCQSHLGFIPGVGSNVNLHESQCGTSIRPVLHEILHLLGFIHEFERDDRPDIITAPRNEDAIQKQTKFDPYSITMYNAGLITPYTNDDVAKPFRGGRVFMSTCDWNLLLTMYPGPNKPPKCRTEEIANVLSPTPSFVNSGSHDNPHEMCHLYNEYLFEKGYCVLPNGQKYPDLRKEFFSDEAIDLSQGTKSSSKRPINTNTKDDTDDSYGSNDKDSDDKDSDDKDSDDKDSDDKDSDDKDSDDKDSDDVKGTFNKHSKKLREAQRKFMRLKSKICHQYISKDPSIFQHQECVSACLSECKRYASNSLTKCMDENYSLCMLHTQRSSLSLPVAYTMSLVVTLLCISLVTNL